MQEEILRWLDQNWSGGFSKQMENVVRKYQKEYGFEIGKGSEATHNNESDAFRHTFMQAYLTVINENLAEKLGNAHEQNGNTNRNQPSGEEKMDQWNNSQGREIGKEIKADKTKLIEMILKGKLYDNIAEKIIERMNAGKIILDPSGRRTPRKPLKKKVSSQTKSECVGSYQVSGYTRSDGVKVSGYTRTCGAKHENLIAERSRYANMRFQDIPEDELSYAISLFI